MTNVFGIYNTANVLQEEVDIKLEKQIKNLLDNPVSRKANIRFMPDAHPGKFFPVGLYMHTIYDEEIGFIPSLIGNDAGCGISFAEIEPPKRGFDFNKIDKVINEYIPNGHDNHDICNVSDNIKTIVDYHLKNALTADVDYDLVYKSIGTLGSGNHFIEIDKTSDKRYYLIVHSGSRYLGNAILEYWLDYCKDHAENRDNNYVYELGSIKDTEAFKLYVRDITVASIIASINRSTIIDTITKHAKIKVREGGFDNQHNIVKFNSFSDDLEYEVCKGVTRLNTLACGLVAINPAEGHLLVEPNNRYNYCLPHGSGRAIARSEVANSHTVSEYKKIMKESNIHCTTISKDNLDEMPRAYRDKEYAENAIISNNLGRIIDHWKPVYSFKPKE